MRHLKGGRELGMNAEHRLSLMRNLTMALIQHERIITTVEKAKEVRPFVEKLITLAKKGTIHARRLALAKLGPMGHARPLAHEEDEAKRDDRKIIKKLFDEIGPRFKDRPGGYTRIIKRQERGRGEAGRPAFLDLRKEGEVRVRARAPAAAPAPVVAPPSPPPAPEASTPPPAPAAPPTPETPPSPAAPP